MSRRRKLALAMISLSLAAAVSLSIHSRVPRETLGASPKAKLEQPVSSPLTPPPAQTPKAPTEGMSTEQFAELCHQILKDLPTAANIRGLTDEEVHDTPEPIAVAGTQLGRIAQAVHDNPSLARAANDFYGRCAHQNEVLTPVRALCYSHVMNLKTDVSSDEVPEEVVRLARLIPRD
jgi:hypothetical protein